MKFNVNFSEERIDRDKLSLPVRVFLWFVEWFARIVSAVSVSFVLLLVALWPPRGATRKFFRVIGVYAYEFERRVMKKDLVGMGDVPVRYKPTKEDVMREIEQDRKK